MKTQSMTIKEFMNKGPEPSIKEKVEVHFRKYGTVYKVAGISLIILTSSSLAFAAGPVVPVDGGVGIGPAARSLYLKLCGVGKWIIIFKGGFETVKAIGNGDFDSAKKNFFAYLLSYLFLLGFPYAMDQVDKVYISATSGQ